MKDQKKFIMDNFNFRAVHAYMELVSWDWINKGVPSMVELKKEARKLLGNVSKGNITTCACGGFQARRIKGEMGTYLTLEFLLTWTESEGI